MVTVASRSQMRVVLSAIQKRIEQVIKSSLCSFGVTEFSIHSRRNSYRY